MTPVQNRRRAIIYLVERAHNVAEIGIFSRKTRRHI